MGARKDAIERLADELRKLSSLHWDRPEKFGDFSKRPELAKLLSLSGGRQDVERLRRELVRVAKKTREEERRDPHEQGSLATAWTTLLQLDEKWERTLLKQRRSSVHSEWKTSRGNPVKSPQSFKENFEPSIYEALARRLLNEHSSQPRRGSGAQGSSQLAHISWPGDGRRPQPGQDVLILIAANAKRRGPNSGLVRLVREFEPHWRATKTFIYSLEGSYREAWRAGLLHDYETFVALPAGFYGGLVHATEAVVAAAESSPRVSCHVVYLVDPHDNSSLYPATAAIKRECILTGTPFLTTYEGAARWFRLDWARRVREGEGEGSRKLLLARPRDGFAEGDGLGEQPGSIALAAHDRHKRMMMEFAESHAELLESHFPKRWATRVTGHLLNGGSINDEEYKNDILYDVKEESRHQVMQRIDTQTEAWRDERENGPGSPGWVTQLTRGRQGGVIQLARKVLNGECDTILFFEDAETPGDQDMEIQVLDRAAQLADGNCLLLYDRSSADRWAQNVAVCIDEGSTASATTLVEAFRRIFDTELVLARPALEQRQQKKRASRRSADEADSATWERIAATAATHVLGVLLTAAQARGDNDEPVRLGFPWGGAIADVIGELPGDEGPGALVAAIGLRRFVEETDAASLYSRNLSVSAGQWPSLQEGHREPFGAEELQVVPTVGVIGARDRWKESHALVERGVKILGGSPVAYPESAFALSSGGESRPGTTQEHWEKLDVLLLSATPLQKRSTKGPAALATGLPSDLADFYKGCACAVSTIYLEKHEDGGVSERSHPAYTQVGISLEQIQDLKERGSEVVLVNGAEMTAARRRAAWAALKAGIASTFVTDEDFAWAVLKEEIAGLKPPSRGR